MPGLRDLLFEPSRIALGRRNRLSNFAFFLLAAAGGSAASVVAILLASWSLISIVLRRFRWRIERSDLPVILSMLLFFAVIVGSNTYHGLAAGESAAGIWRGIGKRLLFVLPLFLVPRMRCSRLSDTLPPAFMGAAGGGVLLIPISIVSLWIEGGRVAGLAGNPGPLSVTGLLTAGWAILALSRDAGRGHLLVCLAGAFGGCLAVVLSGMRGAWPALPLVLLLPLVARRREIAALWRGAHGSGRVVMLAGGLCILAGVGTLVLPIAGARVDAFFADMSQIAANVDSATSLNLRRAMYEAAARAIAARPFFGYGEGAHWTAIEPYLDSRSFAGFSYSHLHNVVLTVGIDAGLAGIAALCAVIAAPLWTAWRARRELGGSRRLAAAGVLVVAFLVPGLSNIMFFHDILDSVWAFAVSLIAASVPLSARR